MKATLEFNLPEDQREFDIANQSKDMLCIIGNLEDTLRSYLKYGHEFKTPEEALQAIRTRLHEEINIRRVNIHD
jgi:hypothetical protein